jgi:hypothetical protein
MKYLYSFILLLIFYLVSFPANMLSANDNPLITELKVINDDSTFRYLYVYDAGNKVLESKVFLKDNKWIRQSLTEWMYDGTNCISQRERVWKNNTWNFSYLINYVFSNNLLQSETHSVYNNGIVNQVKRIDFEYLKNLLYSKKEYANINNLWSLKVKTDFRYLSDNNTDSLIISTYQSDALYDKNLSIFHYNTKGLPASQIKKQLIQSVWVKTDSMNWFYYPNSGKIQTQKSKKWNTSSSGWQNNERVDYQYNDSDQIESETYQYWESMYWANDVRYDYIYDKNILLKKTLSLPIHNDWRRVVSINYSDFNLNKANTIESKYEFYGGNIGELTSSYIPFMFNQEIVLKKAKSIQIGYLQYNDTILSTSIINETNLIQTYPNPSGGIFYLNSRGLEIKHWSVLDLNGRVMKVSDSFIKSGVIDLTDYPKGIYILKVITSDTQVLQRLILQ